MAGRHSAARLSRCISSRYLPGARSSVRHFQSSVPACAEQSQPLYPSVAQLIRENNIPESDISKIPATGPKGRLLKGDVLSYIGAIPSDYPSSLSSQLFERAQLDLSNIRPAASSPPPPPPPQQQQPPTAPQADQRRPSEAPAAVSSEPIPAEPFETNLALPISLSRVLRVQKRVRSAIGVTIPLSTFIARATDIANDELPSTRTRARQEIADQLFAEVIGIRSSAADDLPATSRGDYFPDIISAAELDSAAEEPTTPAADIIDILSGKAPASNGARRSRTAAERPVTESDYKSSVFSLTVPASERLRGQAFLERMQAVLEDEPEKLVVL
ncbi:pyridoxine biosynthesis protein [Coccidioides posadasii str. Silveira]|nr:pyridoxine biosynthesis protein [Coccidioides posadasii str. Silveira]